MGEYTVYQHINKENGKKYIGITSKTVEQRFGKNGNRYICSTYFYNAIKKYGWESFEHEILYTGLTEQAAKSKEVELIEKYSTFNAAHGYNLTYGGQGNVPTEAVKAKMSISQKRLYEDSEYKEKMQNVRKTYTSSESFKAKVSAASLAAWSDPVSREKRVNSLRRTGKTDEFRQKMSKIETGEGNGFYKKKHTEEAKQIMRQKKLGRKLTEEHKQKVSESLKKKVVKLDACGTYIGTYNGISHIKEGIHAGHISECCGGKRETCGGFRWMYYDDYIKKQGEAVELAEGISVEDTQR